MQMKIKTDKPLDDGRYRFVLNSIEEKETIFGDRLMWLFEEVEHGAEVAGFTSLSPSRQANPFIWANALIRNPVV